MGTKTRGWFEQGLKDEWEVASQNRRNRSPRKTEQPKQRPSTMTVLVLDGVKDGSCLQWPLGPVQFPQGLESHMALSPSLAHAYVLLNSHRA